MADSADMNAALKTFFSSPRFAVAGASSDPRKFGHRIHAWYLEHSLPADPLNPRVESVTVLSKDYPTVSSPKDLDKSTSYSLSIITPPAATKTLLQEAKESGLINAVWLQPGTYDTSILEYARQTWPDAVIGGTDIPGSRGGEGWCVLVDGEAGMKVAGRSGDKL